MDTEDRVLGTQGVTLAVLLDAYQRRDRAGLILFRETFAETILRPTASIEKARRAFERIYIRGTTSLSASPVAALAMIQEELVRGMDLLQESLQIARARGAKYNPLGYIIQDAILAAPRSHRPAGNPTARLPK